MRLRNANYKTNKYQREESNLHLTLRTGLLYPLSYTGINLYRNINLYIKLERDLVVF